MADKAVTASDMAVIPLEVVIGALKPTGEAPAIAAAAALVDGELTSAVPIPAPSTAKALARRLMV